VGGFVLSDGKCISHSIAHRRAKIAAVSKGGLASRGALMPRYEPEAPDPTLDSPRKLVKRIQRISGDHRRGLLNDQQALVQLAGCRAAWEVLSGDRRLKVLERDPDDRSRLPHVIIDLGPQSRMLASAETPASCETGIPASLPNGSNAHQPQSEDRKPT
jgi:hypothetical protein